MPILLFIDPLTREQFSYEELFDSLSTEIVEFSPWVQPTTPGEAVRALLTAAVLGQSLTLFDSDISAGERVILGGTDARLAEKILVEGGSWGNPVAMLSAARRQSGFTLTLFTSGTTGLPKRVTHDLEGLTRMLKVSDFHAGNVWGLAYNPTHIAGVQVILQAFFNGNLMVNLFQHGRTVILSALAEYVITHLSATPSFFRLLMPLSEPIQDLRSITLGGECSNAEVWERLHSAFPQARFHNIYASTEGGSLLISEGDLFSIPTERQDRIVVREGRLWIHRSLLGEVEGKREKDNAEQKATRCEQNIEDGCLSSTLGKRSPEKGPDNPGVCARSIGGAGFQILDWYDTGDVVEMVSTHPPRFRIVARERELVNIGGDKVNLLEIEAVLREHPRINEARVYSQKNSVMGQILCAEVAVGDFDQPKVKIRKQKTEREGGQGTPFPMTIHFNEASLRAWLAGRLQPVKIPRVIRFVDGIPLTRNGKIARGGDRI